MGAQQSASSADAGASNTASAPKTCYYELLGVSRDAAVEEIKKAYRRKALELHPDRNLDDIESATRRFAEIQSAHEILSDPQERAWYDDHRDQILSGQDDLGEGVEPTTFRNVRLTSTEEIMTLMRKFNATVPFDDEPTGFYGIARETFEHLALEEEAAAEFADVDSPDYPTFGSSDDDYDSTVKPFYSGWAGFSTLKSFSWKDKYRLSDAPDRRVRRLMEKENKKLREDAIRDFNDAVRFLVTFVRKRDPRYVPNSQSDADRQKSLREAAAKQAARSRAANNEKAASYQLPDWVQQSTQDDAGTYSDESEEAEEEVEILECVVCDKTFKSEKQLEAHERSKKHQKAVYQLRRHLRKEGKELNIDPVDNKTSGAGEDQLTQQDKQGCAAGTDASDVPEGAGAATESEDDQVESGQSTPDPADSFIDTKSGAGPQDIPSPSAEDKPSISTEALKEEDAPTKKIGKAKLKREKKAAAQKQASEEHRCTTCASIFASKTKLFNHVRDEGHAAAVQKIVNGGKNNKR